MSRGIGKEIVLAFTREGADVAITCSASVDEAKEVAGRTLAGRLGTCDDIAKAAVFLASDDASYIIGHTLVVDGGWSAYGYLES